MSRTSAQGGDISIDEFVELNEKLGIGKGLAGEAYSEAVNKAWSKS